MNFVDNLQKHSPEHVDKWGDLVYTNTKHFFKKKNILISLPGINQHSQVQEQGKQTKTIAKCWRNLISSLKLAHTHAPISKMVKPSNPRFDGYPPLAPAQIRFWDSVLVPWSEKTPRPSGNSLPGPGKQPASSPAARQKFSKHPFQFKYLFIHKDGRRWIFASLFSSCFDFPCWEVVIGFVFLFFFLPWTVFFFYLRFFLNRNVSFCWDGIKHRNNIYGSVVVEWEWDIYWEGLCRKIFLLVKCLPFGLPKSSWGNSQYVGLFTEKTSIDGLKCVSFLELKNYFDQHFLWNDLWEGTTNIFNSSPAVAHPLVPLHKNPSSNFRYLVMHGRYDPFHFWKFEKRGVFQ